MTTNHARIIQSPARITPLNPELTPHQPQAVNDEQYPVSPDAVPEAAATISTAISPEAEMVPLAKYQAAVTELARYKAHFGELPPSAGTVTESQPASALPQSPEAIDTSAGNTLKNALPPMASPLEESNNPEQNREETEQLLNILSVNDRDLAHEANDLKELLNIPASSPSTPLKHFGFQRSKSASQ